jgi:hypothetical protein
MNRLAIVGAGLLSIAGFAGAASAGDVPARAYTKAPTMVETAYNWSGLYIGIEGGGDWGWSQHYQNDPAASAANVNPGGRGGGPPGRGGGLVPGPPLLGLAQTGGIDLNGALLGGRLVTTISSATTLSSASKTIFRGQTIRAAQTSFRRSLPRKCFRPARHGSTRCEVELVMPGIGC